MIGSKKEIVGSWMKKAKNDLISAEKLSKEPNIVLDTAIYHCQQAAEKALKGYMIHLDIEFPRTHDLRVLLNMVSVKDRDMFEFIEIAEYLTSLSVEFRYPDDEMEPTEDEFNEAYYNAKMVLDYILNNIN